MMKPFDKDWAGIALTIFVVVFFIFMLAPILVVVVVSFTSAGYVALRIFSLISLLSMR
jgi:putative spermidine/putrescine transport system permease protein